LANRTINQLRAPSAALVLPVLAGIAWMAWVGAPTAWPAINAAALLVALACARWVPLPRKQSGQLFLAGALVALMALTALAGVELDGVRRWIALGPVRLHTGYLVLPLLVVLTSRLPSRPAALLLGAALLATLAQPDRAACYALAAAVCIHALHRRDWPAIGALVVAIASCIAVLTRADPLQPMRFVEGLQADALAANPLFGALLTLATLAPLALLRGGDRPAQPLAAFLLIAGLCAFAGPYPSVLIGYGAAPILGFGLALAALRAR